MALTFSHNNVGEFQHAETNVWFTYEYTIDPWAVKTSYKYQIHMSDGSVRYANILKTVLYVAVDEDEYGKTVEEKWYIKNHKMYDLFQMINKE